MNNFMKKRILLNVLLIFLLLPFISFAQTTPPKADKADLEVLAVAPGTPPVIGRQINVSVQVRQKGPGNIPKSSKISIRLYTNSISNNNLIGKKTLTYNNAPQLWDYKPGASLTSIFPWIPKSTGPIKLIGYIDDLPDAPRVETNEKNNTLSKQVVVVPNLNITLASSPVSQTVSPGASNVEFLGINFKAIGNNVRINEIKLSLYAKNIPASEAKAAIGSIRLYDGNKQIGNAKSFTGTSLPLTATFDNLNYVIPKNIIKKIIIKVDNISATAPHGKYYIETNNLALGTDVNASDLMGNKIPYGTIGGGIPNIINKNGAVAITVGNPTLSVSQVNDGSEITSPGIVIANGTRALGKFRFTASGEDITVEKITIGVSGGTNDINGALADDVIALVFKDASDLNYTIFTGPIDATGSNKNRLTKENSAGLFVVPKNTSKTFVIYGILNNIEPDRSQADSGTKLYAFISKNGFSATSGNMRITEFALGQGKSKIGITGNQKVIFKSQPKLSIPASGLPTKLINGEEIFRFTISADSNGPVALKAFGINISTLGVKIASGKQNIILREAGGSTIAIDSVSAGDIPNGTSKDRYVVLSAPLIVGAGQSKTIIWKQSGMTIEQGASISTRLDINATQLISGQTVQTLLNKFSSRASWIWSDESSGDEDEVDLQWANEYYLKTLPSRGIIVKTASRNFFRALLNSIWR